MATFNDDWFKRILYNNGEGLDYTDLNQGARRFPAALGALQFMAGMQDVMLTTPTTTAYFDPEDQARFGAGSDYGTDLAWAPTPQNGFWEPHASTARTLTFNPGFVAQVLSAPTASDPGGTQDSPFIMAMLGTIGAAQLTLQTAVGDATNPRIDIVEMKLAYLDTDNTSRDFKDATTGVVTTTTFNKTRTVQVTYQIKQGTPAATPAYPTCSAGFVPMCAVYVPASHNAVHSITNFRDMRMPMGRVRSHDVPAHLAYRYGPTPWTLNSTEFSIIAPTGASFAYVSCPTMSKLERVVGVGIAAVPEGANDARLQRIVYSGGAPTLQSISNLSAYTFIASGGGFTYDIASLHNIMDGAQTQGHYVGTRAANTRNGTPIWCNGHAAGPAWHRKFSAGFTQPQGLQLQLQGDASDLYLVRFYTVGGLF